MGGLVVPDTIRRVLSFNDVLLVPRNSELSHLTDANIKVEYSKAPSPFTSYPICNAPMDKVVSVKLLKYLNDVMDMPITIHRWFNSAEEQIQFFESCNLKNNLQHCFFAVGIVDKWKNWIDALREYREKYGVCYGILVDTANGDTKASVETVKYVRDTFNATTNIMAGNCATRSGFARLQDAGANFIRCGVGGGSCCETRTVTGMGVPTLTTVLDCAKVKDTAYLISDGGIETPGDICKAMAAGADMAMLGKMLAATSDSGGAKCDVDGNITENESEYTYVQYSGMASKEAIRKLGSKKSSVSVEGVSGLIPYTGPTEDVVTGILGNMRSSVAYYGGCRSWDEFRRKIKIVEITSAGWNESLTRVKIL